MRRPAGMARTAAGGGGHLGALLFLPAHFLAPSIPGCSCRTAATRRAARRDRASRPAVAGRHRGACGFLTAPPTWCLLPEPPARARHPSRRQRRTASGWAGMAWNLHQDRIWTPLAGEARTSTGSAGGWESEEGIGMSAIGVTHQYETNATWTGEPSGRITTPRGWLLCASMRRPSSAGSARCLDAGAFLRRCGQRLLHDDLPGHCPRFKGRRRFLRLERRRHPRETRRQRLALHTAIEILARVEVGRKPTSRGRNASPSKPSRTASSPSRCGPRCGCGDGGGPGSLG